MLVTLKKKRDFLRTKKKSIPTYSAVVACNITYREPRFGFTASKKVGNAVMRNKAKRRLREVARLALKSSTVVHSDWVLIARKNLFHVPFSTLKKNVFNGIKLCLEKKNKNDNI